MIKLEPLNFYLVQFVSFKSEHALLEIFGYSQSGPIIRMGIFYSN